MTLSGRGTITLNANSFGGDSIGGSAKLLNQSTIQGGGGFDMTFNNARNGVINANESGVQLVVGRNQAQGASTNTGLMEATNGGQLAMGSLTLNNVGGTIKATGKNSYVQLAGEGQGGETFTGGTWTTANGGVIQVVDTTALLDGTNGNTITNSGTMQLVDGAGHPGGNFQGTINNTGTIQILSKGAGVGLNIPGGQTFTLTGTGSLTMGDGTDNAYNNQNYISGATFVNQQLVQGTGNILNLTSFNNSGTINANVPTGSNNLQLQLGRAGASTNTGTIEATNGGGLLVGSTTINNVGGTIAATGANSYVDLVGSLGTSGLTITGGTYTTSGGGVVYAYGGRHFDGTTNAVTNSGLMLIDDIRSNLQIQGSFNNSGTLQMTSTAPRSVCVSGRPNAHAHGRRSHDAGKGHCNVNTMSSARLRTRRRAGRWWSSTIQGASSIGNIAPSTNMGTINANVRVREHSNPVEPTSAEPGFKPVTNSGTLDADQRRALMLHRHAVTNTATYDQPQARAPTCCWAGR